MAYLIGRECGMELGNDENCLRKQKKQKSSKSPWKQGRWKPGDVLIGNPGGWCLVVGEEGYISACYVVMEFSFVTGDGSAIA